MINKVLNSQSIVLYIKDVISSSFVSLVHNNTVIGKGKLPVIFVYTFIILISILKSSVQL